MPGSMRRFSETQENPPPRRDATDRLHSTASDASLPDTSLARQLSQESAEYIPTRITKVAAPKPAANPLQFIKVGPASLYKSAQEQLKKVEEIKKVTKEDRDEPEEWQSNLDNWKSSRRKRQEHIIERVVEVKKFEMEDHDRNRRRSKTFSEMIEERNTRGGKANLVLYTDDDAHDLSDLGIGASGKSNTNEEFEHDVYQKENTSVKDRRKTVVEVCEKVIFDGHGKIGAVKSPPATPYIEVPSTRVVPLQEPEQLKQETVLLNDGVDSGEHVYVESYSFQHAPSDTSVLNVNVESITQEENNVFKVYNNVQQLPSSEFFSQHVPSDRKEEEKSLPFLNSLLPDDTEDVFLPVNGSQIPQLNLSSDVEIVSELSFPLGPSTSTEPPKEKPPPPPPEEISDDEMLPVTNLKRVDSTQRIKNELRRKRSDFLGIEGGNDDSYLEPELTVAPPPDMTTFLVEERRSEQQLYRQSICSETDSNHGETTSRDSGVELDRAQSDDWPGKLTPQILSAQHSRQNSDIYGTASVTSEEDEIMKREREILELLEKEEQWRYSSNTNSGGKGIGEKLTVKLLQLEQENKRLERARSEEENKRQMKENACREEDLRLRAKEQELKQQESLVASPKKRASDTGREERVTSTSGVRVISKLKIPAAFAEK